MFQQENLLKLRFNDNPRKHVNNLIERVYKEFIFVVTKACSWISAGFCLEKKNQWSYMQKYLQTNINKKRRLK